MQYGYVCLYVFDIHNEMCKFMDLAMCSCAHCLQGAARIQPLTEPDGDQVVYVTIVVWIDVPSLCDPH